MAYCNVIADICEELCIFSEFFTFGCVYLLNFFKNFLIVCQDCELYMSHYMLENKAVKVNYSYVLLLNR